MPLAPPRLPGLVFETVRAPAPPGLPRMDVAAFAGFAGAGPVGVPVAIDDEVRFREVFGPDLPLAWDRARGETAYAHLGPAVREFFRNGGRRCWVVRLADEAALETAAFRVPGVLHGRGRRLRAAYLRAASPGSWADGMHVNAALLAAPVAAASLLREAAGVRLAAEFPDLLRLSWPDGTVAFFPPHPGSPARDVAAAAGVAGRVRLAAHARWFRPAAWAELEDPAAAAFLAGPREVPLEGAAGWTVEGEGEGAWLAFRLPPRAAPELGPGCWVRVRVQAPGKGPEAADAGAGLLPGALPEGDEDDGGALLDTPVALADPAPEPAALAPGEGPGVVGRDAYLLVDAVDRGQAETRVRVRRAWRALHGMRAWDHADLASAEAARVSLELWTRHADGSVARLPGVGLVPGHPLALDAAAGALLRPAGLAAETAGTDADDDGEEPDGGELFLPLGVPTVARDDFAQGASTSGRGRLERDGLGAFTAELFLDARLGDLPVATLLETAFHDAYVAEPPRPPARMHALLPVEEVSLLAVPDAVHTGWRLRPEEPPPEVPAPPALEEPVGEPGPGGEVRLAWSAVAGARGYTLQHAPDPRFRRVAGSVETRVGEDDPGTAARVRLAMPCRDRTYFRVRAATPAGPTAWSPAALLGPAPERFDACGRAPLEAPRIHLPPEEASAERVTVRWAPAAETPELAARRAGLARTFRVERSPEPTFSLPEVIFEGAWDREDGTRADAAVVWMPESGTLYLRAASALREGAEGRIVEESPWSVVVSQAAEPPLRWETVPPAEAGPEVVTAVHEAMLRFAAARGDCLSVLSLPRHWREDEALAHAARLGASAGGEGGAGGAGARTLSFGALYHPWTVVRAAARGAAPLRAIPPDGATCGVMAARANGPGAWTAPANQPLEGVAALEPKLGDGARAAFLGRRVNALAPFPRGFMAWSEETLSGDPDLTSVAVRRLLILLRRLALREGNVYVFEANDAAFRRRVQRQFDALLGGMFVRGAFAGARHEEGYRVVTDLTVNPRVRTDAGQLVVELRVAPSRPMAFLTVRLVQTGAGLSVEEG